MTAFVILAFIGMFAALGAAISHIMFMKEQMKQLESRTATLAHSLDEALKRERYLKHQMKRITQPFPTLPLDGFVREVRD